jgi:hypothetical protein
MGHPTVPALHFHAMLNQEPPEVEFALIKRWRPSASPLIWEEFKAERYAAPFPHIWTTNVVVAEVAHTQLPRIRQEAGAS